jgi:hypothetical protein
LTPVATCLALLWKTMKLCISHFQNYICKPKPLPMNALNRLSLAFSIIFILCLTGLPLMAQPVISSFSPAAGPAGTSVVISGNGFSISAGNNIVLFGAVRAQVTAATSTSLTVTVPAGATYQPITVSNNNLTAFSAKPFAVTFDDCVEINADLFKEKTDFQMGGFHPGVFAADLDKDGKSELLVLNSYNNSFSVFRNTGTPGHISFTDKIDFATGANPSAIITADLNGDGGHEVLVVNNSPRVISIYTNTSTPGNISLAPKVDYATLNNPGSIAVGDLDTDGRPDIVLGEISMAALSIFKNTSTGASISFATKTDISTGAVRARSVAMADFDQDNKPDIAITGEPYLQTTVSVFKNNSTVGTISLQSRLDLNAGGVGTSIVAGDLDADGHADLAVANGNTNISVFKNSGIPGVMAFGSAQQFTSGQYPRDMKMADMNGDGKPDLLIANTIGRTIALLRNTSQNGTVTFAAKNEIGTNIDNVALSAADLDTDGKPDITVVGHYAAAISVYRRSGSQKIFLVNAAKTANGTATGLCSVASTDWANACGNLQAAINAAQDGDQIWVASGNYLPVQDKSGNTNPINKKELTFVIKSGVKIYGGFAGNETSLSQRPHTADKTILSGFLPSGTGLHVHTVVSIDNANRNTLLDRFTITNGQAAGSISGGGMVITASTATISNCFITHNSASGAGGGVYINNASPVLVNCGIYYNAAQQGGGVAVNNASPSLVNCTITKNIASATGGGLYSQASATPAIYNSILWGNTGANNAMDNISAVNSTPVAGNSIITQASGIFAGTGNMNINPLFVDALNGNFNPAYGSPAINRGDLTKYPGDTATIDLAGNRRTQNGMISIGAIQQGSGPVMNPSGVLYVDSAKGTLNGNGSSWSSAYPTLAEALLIANANPSIKEIWVAKGTYSPLCDVQLQPNPSNTYLQTFAITRGVTIYGGFAGNEKSPQQRAVSNNETILDAQVFYNYSVNVYHVVTIMTADSTILDGLTISNGSGLYSSYGGGGVRIEPSAKSRIHNCKFIKNYGSAIYSHLAALLVTHSRFTANDAQYGGGINGLLSTIQVDNSDFYDNNLKGNNSSFGGAIATLRCTLNVKNCSFRNNSTINNAGAIHTNLTTASFTNCKFIGNRSIAGGAAYNSSESVVTYTNCLFTKNTATSTATVFNNGNETYTNCTITNNTAYLNGGLNTSSRGGPAIVINNCIIWGNTSIHYRLVDNLYDDYLNKPIGNFSISHSIIGLDMGVYPGTGNLNVDPKYIDTIGGNFNVLPVSPAIDAGFNALYTGDINADTDVDGNPRRRGDSIDIGAFEYGIYLCAEGNTSLSAGITGTAYQWQQFIGNDFADINDNANLTGTNTATLQLSNVPATWNGYQFRCVVDGNKGRPVSITVRSAVTPSVTTSAATSSICAHDTAIFTATPVNVGEQPAYQWFVNGVNAGINHHTFITTGLKNGDQVKVMLTGNAACATAAGVESNVVTMAVQPTVIPKVTINDASLICSNSIITFSATSVNEGTSPKYQWKKNGMVTGSDSHLYTDNALVNGDMISITLTSNGTCAKPATVGDTTLPLVVYPVVTPGITTSGTTTVTRGQATILTTAITHGGDKPVYQWQDSTGTHGWNNIPGVGSATINYIPSQTGDKLRCVLTSNAICADNTTVISNELIFIVNEVTAIDPVTPATYGIAHYPNPVTNWLYIDSLKYADKWQTVEVFNTNGTRVTAPVNISNKTKHALWAGRLSAGMYFAVIKNRTGSVVVIKFMKL